MEFSLRVTNSLARPLDYEYPLLEIFLEKITLCKCVRAA
jgi:hypothetical protein